MVTTRNTHGHLIRPFADVAEGETIHAHGVPLTVTTTATSTPDGTIHSATCHRVTWMVGTYGGADVTMGGHDHNGGLFPFVRHAGDTWTIQRRDDLAIVTSYDNGATWHAPV